MAKITTFITLAHEAEEAAKLYTSAFKNAKVRATTRYGKDQPMPEGTVMTIELDIEGQQLVLLNGGEYFRGKLGDGLSLQINCETQAEVDHLTATLTANGGEVRDCGWITDRFGVVWQVTPVQLMRLIQDKDPEKRNRVMQAMMKMKKLDIAELERAARS